MRSVSRKPFQLPSLKSEVLATLEALVSHVEPGVPPTTLYLCPLPFPPHIYKVLGSTQPRDTALAVFSLFPLPFGTPPIGTFPNLSIPLSDIPEFFGIQDSERDPQPPTPSHVVPGLLPPFRAAEGLALTVTGAWWRSSRAARWSPHTEYFPWSRNSVEDTFLWGDSRPLLPQLRPTATTECLPLPCPRPLPRLPPTLVRQTRTATSL